MNKKQADGFLKKLEEEQARFDQTISDLAEVIRTQVIIPVCQRHKLTFTSGNGTFFFTTKKGQTIGDALEAGSLIGTLSRVFAVLNAEVSHGQYLGYWVSDVRPKDYLIPSNNG